MNPEAIRTAAAEIRATAESYSQHPAASVRALCEQAVFHASRAADRAAHDREFAIEHLMLAEVAASGVLNSID